MLAIFAIALVLLLSAACSRERGPQEPEHHYQLAGVVVSLDAKLQTATVKHGPVKGWMEAMTMEFPVRGAKVEALPPDQSRIEAKLHVTDRSYWVTDVRRMP